MAKKKKKRNISKHSLESQVLNILRKFPNKTFNYKQLSKLIGLGEVNSKQLLQIVLEELETKKKIISTHRGKYQLKSQVSLMEGIVDVNSSANAYVRVDGINQDIFIHQKYLPNVVSGDEVQISIFSSFKKQKTEGEIVAVINRNTTQFVGKLELSETFAFVLISNPKIHFDIFIPLKEVKLKQLKQGQLVVCKITDWGDKKTNPTGTIKEVLGYPGEHQAEICSILAEYQLNHKFDESIEKAAKDISTTIDPETIKQRKDFRNITTFTIDPIDAKDFDDALSIQYLDNKNWEIGIHIADVSHYIHKNDIIDKEAQKRATSIYLVDRVIPMLPEILSNNLCSLRPKEDKLCFSAVFELNHEAKVVGQWFGRTIIHSDKRFTYEEVQKIIESEKGIYNKELLILNKLAKKMRQQRTKNGAISFERSEIKFELDEKGNPISIFLKESNDAHKLIEEFMLLANKKVAEYIGKKSLSFVYRIHDTPDPEKLQTLSFFLKSFGYNLQLENKKSIAQSMNSILNNIHGKEEANMIENLSIRTMAKAKYSTENIGHYGLAFNYYTHFTSPIRRYPDIMVHRLLHHYLNNGANETITDLELLCKHSSDKELVASKAERDSLKYIQAKYISQFIGQKMQGIVSGVTDFGLFIEVKNTGCEGLIRMKDIPNDFYI